jgi:hypothetical protein
MKIGLRTNDGRVVAELDTETATVFKKVNASTHMLRVPPAWTYDKNVIQKVYDWVEAENFKPNIQFVIYAEDEEKTYRLTWKRFQEVAYLMKWRQDAQYEQWAIPLKNWSIDGERYQLELF